MEGFSRDGYIIDQNCFTDYRYRTLQASINGCGWVAVYNILRYLGKERPFEEVMEEMDRMHAMRIPGPTTMGVMRAYIARYLPEMTEHEGRSRAYEAALHSRAGILRYCEADVPHFISYIRDGEAFRFLNVNDGLEDFAGSMEAFFKNHVKPPQYVSAFTIEE